MNQKKQKEKKNSKENKITNELVYNAGQLPSILHTATTITTKIPKMLNWTDS